MDVLRVLMAVALLGSLVDAAALKQHASEDPQITRDDERNTARVKLPKTKTLTTFPDGDGKTVAFDEIITATSSPRDETDSERLQTFTILSDEEIVSATDGHDGSLKMEHTTDSPGSHRHTERSRLFRLLKVIDPDELDTFSSIAEDQERREQMLKMLNALEELHTFINSHPLTVMTRGNSNGRNPGKKNKMVTDGSLKSTTATTVDSGGISPKASTDQTDPKLSGKSLKKSLPSAKKPNKRVCFWKYCSQN